MASREKELSASQYVQQGQQTSDPPRGWLSALVERLIYPFRRGEAPKPQTPTGFYTDTTVCIGCKACEVACKQWNQLPSDGFNWSGNSYDNTNELSATTWRHVKFIEQFSAGSAIQLVSDGKLVSSDKLVSIDLAPKEPDFNRERPLQALPRGPLPSGLPHRRHHSQ
jgi:formate dehydrogenase iron-sulfur subunit